LRSLRVAQIAPAAALIARSLPSFLSATWLTAAWLAVAGFLACRVRRAWLFPIGRRSAWSTATSRGWLAGCLSSPRFLSTGFLSARLLPALLRLTRVVSRLCWIGALFVGLIFTRLASPALAVGRFAIAW
jgi:hypothetical protein